ncbi:MAG TPA: lipid IV(A) 3-deoxy-D-manno-octulosonic acid transferase [Motiliproteus sp.]
MRVLPAALQLGLYGALIRLLLPLGLWLARKQDPTRWRERLGYYPPNLPGQPIWIHAASVGEVKATALLIAALRKQGEHGPFVVTTTTRTGGETLRADLGGQVTHLYAPLDTPPAVRRALARIQPRLLLVMEVEIWPNLWKACSSRQIPIILANARLSERSLRRYQRQLPALWRNTLNRASAILAQTDAIAARYLELGVEPQRLQVGGNLKYSLSIDPTVQQQGHDLRRLLGNQRTLWLAASTHPGEEEIALACHRQLLEQQPELLLVLVPRHPQRFDAVAELCHSSGLPTQCRSQDPSASVNATTAVYLADTLGELLALFCAADLCWVAGSFSQVGGHHILEPAACGCAMVVGPDMANFAEVTQQFVAQQALQQVASPTELTAALQLLLNQPHARAAQAAAAQQLLHQLAGAAATQAYAICRLLPPVPPHS